MNATQDLIAAVLAAADELGNPQWPYFRSHAYISELSVTLREACARAMVQPDVSGMERLVDDFGDACDPFARNHKYSSARTALLDYVRGVLAERDALIADNERLSGLYEQAVKGRADMRSALREARAAAPQPVGEPCRVAQPAGWRCTRANGHEGPCAAVEDRS